jgi:hypothetical protein
MKISGFTIVRNATKLYYPIKPAIESILPMVDEFVIGLGDCDEDDRTAEEISSIKSDKIRIIRSVWETAKYPNGMEYARQTDIAKEACTGDWLFYIQSDEVVHEQYLPIIKEACQHYLHDSRVEGFLFKYRHFWGDYDHYIVSHAWYPREIRIIRNDKDIHSWRDAQSFRRIPDFDGKSFYKKKGTEKLKVIPIDAYINHYGFVRPPILMQAKNKNHNTNYRGKASTDERFRGKGDLFDYGDLSKLRVFTERHPAAIRTFMNKFNWKNDLRYSGGKATPVPKHEKISNKILTLIEQKFLGGRQLFGFNNFILLKDN